MTLIRLPLKTPRDWDAIRIVQLGNGKSTKDLVDYRFTPDLGRLGGIRSLHERGIPLRSLISLADVLRIVGPYATLWVGSFKGTIAPMDVQPTGWVYGNGDEYEPENFWQWTPDEPSEKAMLEEINTVFDEGIKTLFEKRESVFKKFVSFQTNRSCGEVLKIDAIAVQDLPRFVKPDTDWVFEFEREY